MKRLLYVSDMDQTLLDPAGALTETSREGLLRLYDAGVLVSVASARNVLSICETMRGVPLHTPAVAANGAFVFDTESAEVLSVASLEPELAEQLIHRSNRDWFGDLRAPTPFVSSYRAPNHCLYAPEPENGGMKWYAGDRITAGDRRLQEGPAPRSTDLANGIEAVTCVTFIDSAEVLTPLRDRLRTALGDRVAMNLFENQYSPGWYWLTVLDPWATKAYAIDAVIRMLGKPSGRRQDYHVVAFGDSTNDIPLLESADHSVAVENAVDSVKAIAAETIGPHDEDSVVRYILEREGLA